MEPGKGRFVCCNALKTQGLQQVLDRYRFKGVFLGIRRDRFEEVAIRLCTADQLEKIARLAFGYGLGMTFRRGPEGNRVVLFREGPVSRAPTEDGFPVI